MLRKFCLFLFISYVCAKHEIYDGWGVYEVSVENENQLLTLQELIEEMTLDVWSYAHLSRPGIILVPKLKREEFHNRMFVAGLPYVIESDNVKELLDLEDIRLETAATNNRANYSDLGLDFETIHRFDVVDQYLVDLAAAHPNVVTVMSAGRSIEGRDIKYVQISTTNFQNHSKPVVFVESLLHAREWATLPATLYAIKRLVLDVTERDLVEDIDWVILPIANPDGYEFTHTNQRFWRKNRARGFLPMDRCMGVDLNRNFNVNWGTASSNNVCSDTFHGRHAFSEPESTAVGNIMRRYSSRLAFVADLHTFGSMILYGYGNGELPANVLLIHLAGVQMAQAIDAVKWPQNRDYTVGNVVAILYHASGSAGDYGQLSALPFGMSYTFELPAWRNNQGFNGFLIEPDFIEQVGFETWEGLKVGVRFALNQWRQHRRSL